MVICVEEESCRARRPERRGRWEPFRRGWQRPLPSSSAKAERGVPVTERL